MVTWSLTIAGTTRTLPEWRIADLQLHQRSLAPDQLTFTAPRARFDEDELCAYGDELILTRIEDGASEIWFRGTRQLTHLDADAAAQFQTYLFDGPWRYLEENILQQPWGVGQLYTDHIILNQFIGQDIKLALDYAIANGALLQYDLADLTALNQFPPADEITGQNIAEVIRTRLHFSPDTIQWFDYTTTPPTLRLQRRSNLTARALRIAGHTGEEPLAKVRTLRPRPDLQVPSVKINAEIIETIDNVEYLIPDVDIYPPGATGREDGALNSTITLQGRTTNNLYAEIECQTIVLNTSAAGLEWLKQHIHILRDPRVTILAGPTNIQRLDENGAAIANPLPSELIQGQIADWMGLEYQREIISVRLSYQVIDDEDGAGALEVVDDKLFTFEIITTDAPAGVSNYSIAESGSAGDPPILGLAEYLYTTLNPLHYDGVIDLEEQDCTGHVRLGHAINLLGSRAEYGAMSALVQQVTFDIFSGMTSIQFGPPRHLTISDILTLLQRFRTRRRWTNPVTQETGELSGTGSNLELGKAVPNTNALNGAQATEILTVRDGNNRIKLDGQEGKLIMTGISTGSAPQGSVTVDIAQTRAGNPPAPRELRIREYAVCIRIGNQDVQKKALFIASDYYD